MTSRCLADCSFTGPDDDYTYLVDESKWIRKLSYRISLEEIKEAVLEKVKVMITDLDTQPGKTDVIIEKVFSRGAEHTYLSDTKLPVLDFNERKEIEACFVATILRYKLLQTPLDQRDTSAERARFKESLRLEYADFMGNETGNDTELTWLFRFERAISLAKSYINGNRNKGLFLSVGNLLEGSDDFTRYITGGHASKETKRRVLLIEHLCEIKPRKRTRKLAEGPLQKRLKDEQDSNNTLHQFAEIALLGGTADFSLLGFTIDKILDENTIYQIFFGKKTKTGSEVNLKMFNKQFSFLFAREVELMKKLNQRECILHMVDFMDGNHGENNFIVYENGYHRKLNDLIGEDMQNLVTAIMELIDAVYFVHSYQVIIRNLKPESVYLVGYEQNLKVKIGGFTHAVHIDYQTMKSETVVIEDDLLLQDGLFLSPELFSEQVDRIDYKVDVWSIGMIAFFLLGGYLPWKEINEIQESIDVASPALNQLKITGLIDQMPLEEGIIKFLKNSLEISVNERSSLLQVREVLKQASSVGNEICLQHQGGSNYLQTSQIFERYINAVVGVAKFEKTQVQEGTKFNQSSTTVRSNPQAEVSEYMISPSNDSKYLKAFRRAMNAVITIGRFQKINSLPTIIATFSVKTDYSCHIVWNNRTRTKQIMKQIKVKSAQYDNEYSILRTLNNHPAISQLLDYVEGQYQRYMMLERLDDGWLLDLMNVPLSFSSQSQSQGVAGSDVIVMKAQRQPVLKESCIQSIAKSLVSAVDYMHSKGIIHRGLNLSSILMKRVSEDEIKIKIWDFHTAIMKESSYPYSYGPSFSSSFYSSATSTAWAHYPEDDEEGYYCVAPEILRNMVYPDKKEMYDEKADYWSVGMILYILAEGKSCFPLRDPALILAKVVSYCSVVNISKDNFSSSGKSVVLGLLQFIPQSRLWISHLTVSSWLNISSMSSTSTSPSFSLSSLKPSYFLRPYDGTESASANFPPLTYSSILPLRNDFNFEVNARVLADSSIISKATPSSSVPSYTLFDNSSSTSPSIKPTTTTTTAEMKEDDFITSLLELEVFKKRDCYLKYFEYQKALKEDDLIKATAKHEELSSLDNAFDPKYDRYETFMEEFQNKYQEFSKQLLEFKKIAMTNPKNFGKFKQYIDHQVHLKQFIDKVTDTAALYYIQY